MEFMYGRPPSPPSPPPVDAELNAELSELYSAAEDYARNRPRPTHHYLSPRERGPRAKKTSASGLVWRAPSGRRPTIGMELTNAALARALVNKLEFHPTEWESFGIAGLTTRHFIEAGGKYFQPVASAYPADDGAAPPGPDRPPQRTNPAAAGAG